MGPCSPGLHRRVPITSCRHHSNCWRVRPRCCAPPTPAAAQAPAPLKCLRLAIEDLTTTFGPRYPQGRAFAARLAELERRDGASGQIAGTRRRGGTAPRATPCWPIRCWTSSACWWSSAPPTSSACRRTGRATRACRATGSTIKSPCSRRSGRRANCARCSARRRALRRRCGSGFRREQAAVFDARRQRPLAGV